MVPVVVVPVVTVATDAVTRERARRVVLLVNLLLRSVVDSVVAVGLLLHPRFRNLELEKMDKKGDRWDSSRYPFSFTPLSRLGTHKVIFIS